MVSIFLFRYYSLFLNILRKSGTIFKIKKKSTKPFGMSSILEEMMK